MPPKAPETSLASDPYRTRYDIARQGYEMRVAELARALDQATFKNYLSAAGNLLLGCGIVMIALRGGVRPIFVPYDHFGRIIQYDDLARMREPSRGAVEAELGKWLVATRGIYYGDPVAQLDRARLTKAFLSPEAEEWLTAYYADPSRSPSVLLREQGRTVEVVSISKDPERDLWYFQWREIDKPRQGQPVESAWQATVKVQFVRPNTEYGVWANPTGIRITAIEWDRLRQRPTEPAPSPAAATPP